MTRLVAIVGPSGAGKDTLIRGALAARPDLHLARRVITRPADTDSEDFDSVTEADFAARRRSGAFALDWQAHGLHYAIPTAALARPGIVLFNGSRAALALAVARFPGLEVILVTAPDQRLATRLAARGRETDASIAARLGRAGFGLPAGITAQVVVNDGTVAEGVAELLAALQPDRG